MKGDDKTPPQGIEVFLDFTSNLPRDDETRARFRERLTHYFEEKMPAAVERQFELPPIIVKGPNKDYAALLIEAREIYVAGYFYPCVAMCGIVSERLIKDALREAVLIRSPGKTSEPTEDAFKQLERVDASSLIRFLESAEVFSEQTAKAARKLGELRNSYAHARGTSPSTDALQAIKWLHEVVEGTVSMFKDHTIKDGVFVQKVPPTES